jgi:hypothetical protein
VPFQMMTRSIFGTAFQIPRTSLSGNDLILKFRSTAKRLTGSNPRWNHDQPVSTDSSFGTAPPKKYFRLEDVEQLLFVFLFLQMSQPHLRTVYIFKGTYFKRTPRAFTTTLNSQFDTKI